MIEVNWSPFATNPLDHIEGRTKHKFISANGETVKILMPTVDFIVQIGDRRVTTGGNVNTCYFLNQNGVGIDHD